MICDILFSGGSRFFIGLGTNSQIVQIFSEKCMKLRNFWVLPMLFIVNVADLMKFDAVEL